MNLSKDMNLVIAVERDGVKIHVHSVPVSRETFENYHAVLAKTFSQVTDGGLNVTAGLATAALALRDAAKARDMWEGPAGVKAGLMNEIRRITSVIAPGDNGNTVYTLHDAATRGVLDEDEVSEVENAIVFFTLVLRMFRKAQVPMMVSAICGMGGLSTTSLSSTAFSDSLRTSTATETLPPQAG